MSNTSTTSPFIIDDSKIDNTIMITTNLYPAITPTHTSNRGEYTLPGEIITQGYAKTLANGGYIKVPYISPAGAVNANATFVNGTTVKYYKTSNMYIFKASHAIQNITYDAEMVIELVPTTNPGEKLYLCFLLQGYRDKKTPLNDIDNIIISSDKSSYYKTTTFNLEPLIMKNQKKIIYTNNMDNIIIFTEKIKIKEYDFSNYMTISLDLFPLYPTDYKLIHSINQEGFKASGRTAVMTCTPMNTGEAGENDNEIIYMNTEKNTTMMSNSMLSSILSTLIITFICLFAVPPVYFMLISNPIVNSNEKILYTSIIMVLLIILSIVLIFNGKKYDPYDEPMAGFVIIMMVVISFMGVNLDKQKILDNNLMFKNFILMDALNPMLKKITSSGKYIMVCFIALLIILFSIVFAAVKKRKFKQLKKKDTRYINNLSNIILGVGLTYGLVFIALIACFITSAE